MLKKIIIPPELSPTLKNFFFIGITFLLKFGYSFDTIQCLRSSLFLQLDRPCPYSQPKAWKISRSVYAPGLTKTTR